MGINRGEWVALLLVMTAESEYGQRAEEAKENAERAPDQETRDTWLEIAETFDWLANKPKRERLAREWDRCYHFQRELEQSPTD